MIDPELHAKLAANLEREEGRCPRAYPDSEGIWTVGIGWNLEASDMPDDVIDRLRDVKIQAAVVDLGMLEPRWQQLDGERQLVLLEMAFQLGRARLRKFVRFWKAIAAFLDGKGAAHLTEAAAEILDSKLARQAPTRAKRLADRMRSGLPSTP